MTWLEKITRTGTPHAHACSDNFPQEEFFRYRVNRGRVAISFCRVKLGTRITPPLYKQALGNLAKPIFFQNSLMGNLRI